MRRCYLSRMILATILSGLVLLSACSGGSNGHLSSSHFASETIVSELFIPTDFAFAPDGRIFVAQKRGKVRVFKDGELLPDPFIELTVNSHHERGLLGLALDPAFETTGYVYLYYVVENSPDDFSGPKTAQLLRVTADGDIAAPGSELVLLGSDVGDASHPSCSDLAGDVDCIPADAGSHNGGGIGFTSDGKLIIGIGDAEQFWPAQDPDSLSGKIVRINPDGTVPSDNPFYAGPNLARSKVWAYGLRNPFRLGMQPGTDLPFVGDVGSYFEEIDVGAAGANFGWPCYSNDVQERRDEVCRELDYASATTAPLYAYPREDGPAAIIAGAFYQGGNYPSELEGAFFFGDYMRSTISILKVDADNNLIRDSVREVYSDANTLVDLEIGPDGDLYYLSMGRGEVRRLCYVPDGTGGRCE